MAAGRVDFFLDGVLSTVSDPRGPIGEPIASHWAIVSTLLQKNYKVNVLTWRQPSQVYEWLYSARLEKFLERGLHVTDKIPLGIPTHFVSSVGFNEMDRFRIGL